jgi:hypothetical protein
MAVDSRQQSQLNGMSYDPLRYPGVPQFTNPWVNSASGPPANAQLYASSQPSPSGLDSNTQIQRPTNIPLPSNYSLPITTASLGPPTTIPAGAYASSASQDLLNGRSYTSSYSTSGTTASYAPASAGYPMDYSRGSGYGYGQDNTRRGSHPLNNNTTQAQRNSFSEALDASRGMISLSQSDITPTPRNMYGNQSNRSSPDSYGFPATHSAHSSISSASTFGSYYGGGSVGDGSLTDYSSASESVDLNRTLPRPSTLVGTNMPPAPQSMMGQFNSKVSSSSQKKHKCKVCDKRFTRPSSLQTHMYSHTGEKPFACEVEGCGRHFSVVSNLRRHRKVHKNDSSGKENPSADEA